MIHTLLAPARSSMAAVVTSDLVHLARQSIRRQPALWRASSTLVNSHVVGAVRTVAPLRRSVTSEILAGGRSFASAASSLEYILGREHAEEVNNKSTEMPPELETLKKKVEGTWKIVSEGATTRMYRTLEANGAKVQLSFHCQDSLAAYDDEEPEEEATEEVSDPVRFTVIVTKAGRSMVLQCMTQDAMARIQSVAMTNQEVSSIEERSGSVADHLYQGPEFDELAENLQDAFHTYLEDDVGINEDVASFIAMYTDYQEQCEYVKFLEEAKSVLT